MFSFARIRTTRQLWLAASVAVALAVGAILGLHATPAQSQSRSTSQSSSQGSGPQLTEYLLDALPFRLIGPASPSGRVWQIVGIPFHPKVYYVCTADGGVWKTDNNGTTFVPIFNDEPASSCGAVAIDIAAPNIVWVGTGEPASVRSNSLGRGVFKSTDAGATWHFMGLKDTEEISAIAIDPRTKIPGQVVYVAALGHLWGKNEERGIFKTSDGGLTWQKVLYVNDSTGFSDLVMDPHSSSVLYAAAWQRLRYGGGDMTESGSGSGIYKSTDAGKTWTRLTNGLPADPMGKITLAVGQQNSQKVYAAILTGEPVHGEKAGERTSNAGGIFFSYDAGASWQRVSPMMTSYYYDRIVVDPTDDLRPWMPALELWRSFDDGRNWHKHNLRHVHNDLHTLWIDPGDVSHMLVGGDGGVYSSSDSGRTWEQHVLPIAQFYDVDVDDQAPYWVYGGMQDTGHWTGPSQTYDNEGITNYDWIKLRFNGDGMAIHPDPRDPNVIYMTQEFGNTSRLDLRDWSRLELQPPPEMAKRFKLHPFRWDWTPPMIRDSADPDSIYLGANYVFHCQVAKDLSTRVAPAFRVASPGPADHETAGAKPGAVRSLQLGESACQVISPDLSAQQQRTLVGARGGYHSYGALSSLAQSPVDSNVLWAGADDGPIYVSRDRGGHWTRIDTKLPAGSPTQGVVASIEPSRTRCGAAYVAYDLHTRDDRHPYVFKTTDFGETWMNVTGDLPEEGSTYVIREDPHNPQLLFAGTEFGLYVSIDGGKRWVRWKSTLPMSAVRAMVIQSRDRELVVGTFGRAIWIADIAPLEQMAEALSHPAYLFDAKPAVAYNVRYTYGATIEELNGDMFFRGDNPPYGATITYYLRDEVPGGVRLTIRDREGKPVRSLEVPGTPGLHRVTWDLEGDAARSGETAAGAAGESVLTLSEQQALRRVVPGAYRVSLEKSAARLAPDLTIEVRPEADGVRRVLVRK